MQVEKYSITGKSPVSDLLDTVKTVICELHLDLDKKIAYGRGWLDTMSNYIGKMFLAD